MACSVIYGFAERSTGPVGTLDTVYNSANVVGADGLLLQTYRKCHLWGSREKAIFKPGEQRLLSRLFTASLCRWLCVTATVYSLCPRVCISLPGSHHSVSLNRLV